MKRPDSGVLRFLVWFCAALALTFTLFQAQASTFGALLNGQLADNFGTAFPAFPFAALLCFLLYLRWGDLHAVLLRERGLASLPGTRVLGLGLTLSPLTFAQYATGSLEISAFSLILVFYGTFLVLNPLAMRLLFPYAALFAGGVTVPAAIEYLFGEPLAGLATYISEGLVGISGIPVAWHGTEFELVSRAGTVITGTVTPGCSSVLSVTTFLGLLGLMHFDMRKDVRSTLKLAVAGTAALVLLNSARIGILIWAGYSGGADAIWGVHNWIGYAIFLGFYLGVLVVYSRMKSGDGGIRRATATLPTQSGLQS